MSDATTSDGCTLNDVEQALQFIAYDIRDDWIMAGMAIKAEFGEDGFSVWDDWSSQYEKYKPSEVRAVWRSFKGGKTGIGSLFHIAIANGYKPAKCSAEEKARFIEQQKVRQAKRKLEIEAEEKQAAAMQDVVASKAFEIWSRLSTTGKSDYLANKSVDAHGVRFAKQGIIAVFDINKLQVDLIYGSDNIKHFFAHEKNDNTSFLYIKRGCLAIPLVDEKNVLKNLQIIFLSGKKRFLKHGQKQGCFHFIGQYSPNKPLCIAEGYSTSATIFQATGWPVAIAFDSGNIRTVARSFRKKHREDVIIICGDNDLQTKGNPGYKAATDAANDIDGLAVFPIFSEAIT